MALTADQKAQVRRYLGFPDINRIADQRLEGAMTSLSTEGESYVGSLLTSLASIQTKLTQSWDRQKVQRAEEITLAGPEEIRALRAEGNRLAQDLGVALNVRPQRQPFSSGNTTAVLGRG